MKCFSSELYPWPDAVWSARPAAKPLAEHALVEHKHRHVPALCGETVNTVVLCQIVLNVTVICCEQIVRCILGLLSTAAAVMSAVCVCVWCGNKKEQPQQHWEGGWWWWMQHVVHPSLKVQTEERLRVRLELFIINVKIWKWIKDISDDVWHHEAYSIACRWHTHFMAF